MMFHQTTSRRGKSSKGKNLFQGTVLFAVVVWLLYQTKHSYDRKNGYVETDVSKLSKGGTEVRFGRKVDPGSGSGISIDPHGNNSDGATDTGEAGVDQDVFDHSFEEKAEDVRHESEKSPEDIVDSGKEDIQQEQQDNVTDNGESNNAMEVNTEDGEQGLQRPGGRDGENADQNETQSEDSSAENEHPKDGAASADSSHVTNGEKIASDEATLDTNQGENVESAEQQSETTEAGGEHSDDAVRGTQELANSSVSDDQSNQNLSEDKDSQKEETVEAQEVTATNAKTTSNKTAEEAATNDQSDVASHAEIAGNGSIEAAEEGSNNFPKGVDENPDVMPDSNGAPGREEDELQTDRIIEGQAAGNYSVDGMTADTSSDGGENASSSTSEENGTVMSDNNGVPQEEGVQPHVDHVSEDEKTDNSLEEANADKSNSEVSEKEANSSGDEGTAAAAAEKENDPKSSVETANSSLDSKNEHAQLPANTEGTVMAEAQAQGNAAADAENTSKTSPEEEEKIASVADRSSKEVDDAMAEPQSKNATASDSGNKTELSSGNNTGSGASGSEAFIKKSAEL